MPRFLNMCYRSRAWLDAAVAMLAIREYHRRQGVCPSRLDELVPDHLPRLPIDYVDRKPLRYRRTDDGYLLYSIGLNGKDDGGISGRRSPYRFDEENPDVVFSEARREELRK
jgi:hypothetical protein